MSVADRLSALTPEQRALFEKLRQTAGPPSDAAHAAAGAPGLGPRRGRLAALLRPGAALAAPPGSTRGLISWNVDAGSRVRGELDVPRFLAAFRELIRRHAAWRTTFPVVDGRPVQRVRPEAGARGCR